MTDSERNTTGGNGDTRLAIAEMKDIILAEVSGAPRVLDLDLADRLGFDRPRNIRKLIRSHEASLRRFGEVCSVRSKPGDVGRPSVEYWLNQEQAVFIASKSDTPLSAEVSVALVRVFFAWRRGDGGPLNAKIVGGVVKSVVHREIADALHDILPAMIREAVGSTQFGVIQGLTAGDVLDAAGVRDRKGLRGLARRVSDRLRLYHAERKRAVELGRLGSNKAYMFDPLTSREWLEQGGKASIEAWVAERRGQGVLKLVPKGG